MSMPPLLFAVLAGSALWVAAAPARPAAADPLAAYRGRNRILVVSAPSPDDPLLGAQRHVIAAMRAGARERDLVPVEAVGDGRAVMALRRDLQIEAGAFQVLLVGKDGGVKLRSAMPLGPEDLFPAIDAMPMRREEMNRPP